MRDWRTVGRSVAGLSLVVTLAVAGFAMSFARQVPTPVAQQRPGTCHLAEDPNELIAIPSDTAPPVPCTEPHQTETMFVTTVMGPLAASKTRPNGELLNKFASGLCYNYPVERAYLGAGPSDVTYGIYSWARFPTAAAWAAGDRSLACQGSTQPETPNGPTIDFPIAGVMTTYRSALFRLCRMKSARVTCNLPHTGEDTSPNAILPPGPWPGPAKVAQLAQKACLPIVDTYLKQPLASRPELTLQPDPVSQVAWMAGDHSTDCWLDNTNVAVTTGTARGGLRP